MFVPDMAVILLSKHSSLNILSTAELEKCKDEVEQEKVIYQNIKVWTICNSTLTDVFENRSNKYVFLCLINPQYTDSKATFELPKTRACISMRIKYILAP